jgi:hypothetical protein
MGDFLIGRISGTRKDMQGIKTPPCGYDSPLDNDINVGKMLLVVRSVEGLPCRRALKRLNRAIFLNGRISSTVRK